MYPAQEKRQTIILGYHVMIEVEEGSVAAKDPESIRLRLADGCQWIDGVLRLDCDYMGTIEVGPEQPPRTPYSEGL